MRNCTQIILSLLALHLLLGCSSSNDSNTGSLLEALPTDSTGTSTEGGGFNFGTGEETPFQTEEGGGEGTGNLSNCPEAQNEVACTCPDGSNGQACADSLGTLVGECICEEPLEEIPCAEDSECPESQPYCKSTISQCVECLEDSQCESGEFCNNGQCKALLCGPDENVCNGNKLQACNSDGTSFESFDCEPGTCLDGACVGCELGETECLSGNVVECVDNGTGTMIFQEVEICDSAAQCYDGICLECFPGQGKCEGKDAYLCAADGLSWELYQTCSAGQACISGSCQSLCAGDIKFNTNVGCDYWAVDLDNVEGDGITDGANNAQFAIVVSNTSDTEATITVRNSDEGPPTAEAVVAAGGLQIFNLAPYNIDGSVKTNRAWRLEASAPIVAYQFNPLENELVYSNDASVLFPSNSWGTDYYIMSRGQLDTYGRGFLTVVAGFSGTEVTVTVTTQTLAGPGVPALSAGGSHTFTLEPYEILNIESDVPDGDLTGSRVTSTQPVGVFGGHECAVTADSCCCDHLEQMMIPIKAWGKKYVASRSAVRGVEPDYWRILASEDGTVINTNPHQGTIPTLNAGQSWEITTSTSFLIQSNKPVMVGQYLASSYEINGTCSAGCQNGTICDPIQQICTPQTLCFAESDCPNGHTCSDTLSCEPVGDPAFILAVPVEQFRDSYVFLSPSEYLQDYVNVIAPVGTQMLLDGSQTVTPTAIPGACTDDGICWGASTLSLQDGTHTITSTTGEAFGVVVYGYDDDVSYGYPGGLDLKDLSDE